MIGKYGIMQKRRIAGPIALQELQSLRINIRPEKNRLARVQRVQQSIIGIIMELSAEGACGAARSSIRQKHGKSDSTGIEIDIHLFTLPVPEELNFHARKFSILNGEPLQ